MTQTTVETGHVALYRKYRPTGFDSLIGQNHIRATLENAIKLNKVSHAYLFTGPRGTGKTSTAKLFAKALNCKQPIGINPCGTCDSCKDGNLDIIEMDAASNNGVDDIREMRLATQTAPLNSKYKVFIIDECHMITNQGFNALLKTLEEPPAHVIFILATTEAHKVPATILSRCQRYDFKRIAQHNIIERLSYVAKEENIQVEPQAIQVIAQVAAGGLRDALGLLDQASSLAEGEVTLDAVLNLTGAVDIRKIGELLLLIASRNTEKALGYFNMCYEQGNEPKYFLEEMQVYLRDVLVYSKIGDVSALKKAGTDANFPSVVQGLSQVNIYNYLNQLQDTLNQLKVHHDAQLLIEMAIIQMTTVAATDLQSRVGELEMQLAQLLQSGTISQPQSINEPVMSQLISEIVKAAVVTDDIGGEMLNNQHNEDTALSEVSLDSIISSGIESNPMELTEESVEVISPVDNIVTDNQHEENVAVSEVSLDSIISSGVESNPMDLTEESVEAISPVDNIVTDNQHEEIVAASEVTLDSMEVTENHEESINNIQEDEHAEEIDITSNMDQFIGRALEEPNWPEYAHEYTELNPPPMDENKMYEEPMDQTEQPNVNTQTPSNEGNAAPINTNVILDDKELIVMRVLKTAVKEHRDAFNGIYPAFEEELKAKKSTFSLFREFTVKAVNENSVIITHDEKVKVKLLEKVKNHSTIECAIDSVYKPLEVHAITTEQWLNCVALYKAQQKS